MPIQLKIWRLPHSRSGRRSRNMAASTRNGMATVSTVAR